MSDPPETDGPAVTAVAAEELGNAQIPDGGYGWVCVLACFLVNCFTWGITAVRTALRKISWLDCLLTSEQSYGVYLSHYLDYNTFPGASAMDFAFIGGFNFSAAMIVSPLVTVLTREYGKHITMAIGVLLQAAGFATASVSHALWQLYLSQGIS